MRIVSGSQSHSNTGHLAIADLQDDDETESQTISRLSQELSDLNNRLMGAGEPLCEADQMRLKVLQRIDWPRLQ